MPSKYLIFVLVLLMVSNAGAQNIPDLGATAPSGTAATISVPPDLSNTILPNLIRVYVARLPETNAANFNLNSNPQAVQTISLYTDGFNRPVQSVRHYFNSGSKPHLVQPYDTRFMAEDIRFLPYPATDAEFHNNLFAIQQYYYNSGQYAGEQYTSYGISRNISDGQQRAMKNLLPGLTQVGQDRGVTIQKVTNAAGEVKIWKPDIDGKPIYIGTYPPGALYGELAYNSMGAVTTVYTDHDGKIICRTIKQNDQSVGGGGVLSVSGTTYYIYDDMGRLICTMPPKASAASSTSVSQTIFDNLCFRYQYDIKGRPTGQRYPGEDGFVEVVYDRKERPVMRRTPNEKITNQWEITFYDAQGRIKATSLLSDNSSQETWQSLLDAGSGSNNPTDLTYYLLTPEGEGTYPSESSIANNMMLSYTYYDDYTLSDPGNTKWNNLQVALSFNETLNTDGAEQPIRSNQTHGRVTGTRKKILAAPSANKNQTGDWRETVNYYDIKGRTIYNINQDFYQGAEIHVHYDGSQYDFADRLILSKHVIKNSNDTAAIQEHTEWSRNEYDPYTGKLNKTLRRTDTGIWITHSMLNYDDLGRRQRKVFGNYGEVQDYNYNIRGQLTGINDYYTRTGDRQGESRSFGESLCYDFGFTQPRYDGKVAGMIWRGSGSSLANAYGYNYDYSGRLTEAEYRRYEPPSGSYLSYAWRSDLADYTVSNLRYDRDGNIKSMDQRCVQPGGNLVTMDQLVYTYEANEQSNRLNKVVDNAPFYGLGDFNNTNGSSSDYGYDSNGNVIQDNNKGITAITYTHFNKPQTVTFIGGKNISYSYDAAGNKVQELINDNGIIKQKDYLDNYIYENNSLQYALNTEGRSIYNRDHGSFIEEYFIKDHLNNVRSVVEVWVPPIQEYLGTYEIASANLEGLFFEHHNEIRDDKPGGVPGDNQAGVLNGAHSDKRIGTSMLVHVMAGDKIEMNVNNFYEGYQPQNDAPVNAEDMLATIINTLRGGIGGFEGSESHNIKTVTDVFTIDNFNVFDQIVNNNSASNKPKAYLNYVMFDENLMIVPNMSGAFQADGEGGWTQIGTTTPLEFTSNGYLAVYLSNASQNVAVDEYGNVYFDQLVIRISRGKLKEEAHYYPHGLPINGMGSTANSYVENRNKFQSNEYQQTIGLNWMDSDARQYDPQIGRFWGVDPLSDKWDLYSPYCYAVNNPVSVVDPDGRDAKVTGSGTKNDPFVITAIYFYEEGTLTKSEIKGFEEAIDEYNKSGGEEGIKVQNEDGTDSYVKYSLSIQSTTDIEASLRTTEFETIGGEDRRYGSRLGTEPDNANEFGSANNRRIDFNRDNIKKGVEEMGADRDALTKATAIHEIGHNIGGDHSDGTTTMQPMIFSKDGSGGIYNGAGNGPKMHIYYPSTSKKFTRIVFRRRDTPKENPYDGRIWTPKILNK